MAGRMFEIAGQRMTTWNVLHGCRFDCSYCSVRSLVATKLSKAPKYARGMEPGLAEREINRHFKPGEWVFVGYMGDVACQPFDNVRRVLERIDSMPEVNFYFQSKDPAAFLDWHGGWPLPRNITFGTTLETNRAYTFSCAPPPVARLEGLFRLKSAGYGGPHKTMLSIEPVMDFDLGTFSWWIDAISPERVFIGADNYGHNLPEPSESKLRSLIEAVKSTCPEVILKPGIERLLR